MLLATRTRRRLWRIGELAETTGLTVHTFHHYEQIGLLPPPTRSEGQQRVYDDRALERLRRIRALRDLGLPRADIGAMLDETGSLAEVLRAHRVQVIAEIDRREKLRATLDQACAYADQIDEPGAAITAIEATARVLRGIEGRNVDPSEPGKAEQAWRARSASRSARAWPSPQRSLSPSPTG